jgi:hypothetical protein
MLNEIKLDKLDAIWPWVMTGLKDLQERVPGDWDIADVYLALKHQRAVLFTIGEDSGFTVLQMLTDASGPHLFVWLIYGPNELAGMEQELYEALRDKAIALGAKVIRMKSPRKGWAQRGWRVKEYVYEMGLWKTPTPA